MAEGRLRKKRRRPGCTARADERAKIRMREKKRRQVILNAGFLCSETLDAKLGPTAKDLLASSLGSSWPGIASGPINL